jgi:hypothetical protein
VGTTRVTSVYRARDAEKGKVALDAAASALRSFTSRFGAYPYPELDVVEASIVGGAGGVEFSSLVLVAGMFYRDASKLESPMASLMKMWGTLGGQVGKLGEPPRATGPKGAKDAGAAPKTADPTQEILDSALEFTVAHEVAHQWFAGIVGNDSHRSPSLDEPMAQYAAGLAIEDRRGAAAAKTAMDHNVKLNYALYRLLGGPDRPVLRDTAQFRTQVEYAALVYGKAPYAYVALRKSLGDERLHRAIRHAVKKHHLGIATTEQWIAAVDEGAGPGSGVKDTFRRWLSETHGDADLGVDDSGEFVMTALFPREVADTLRQSLPAVGMKPKDLLRMVFGGALGDDAPIGPGIDPADALRALGR